MTGDRPAATDVNAVIDAHERSGYRLAIGGVDTFVLDVGHGQPVVCLHGVPASSFLYRKLVVELAARGLRGIAFDLPGRGLRSGPQRSTTRGRALADSHPPRSKPSTSTGSIWWCTISERRWASSLPPRIRAESPRLRC
jgi:pimeloyl-ACP methyl ester carboxylesterase